jgi:hypothetical protein
MPLTFRLLHDHFGEPFSSDSHYIALSGDLGVGTIRKDTNSPRGPGFEWRINGVQFLPAIAPTGGFSPTLVQAKSELEASWFAWVEHAGLKDDPEAQPCSPVKVPS